ncbi:hypothetical protein AB0X79_08060 [Pediococcus pentosaceus]|uniref:hypothetical protein n=1 Tax=Pediococcus pentosaceus TaxID=1255 RepID=UPI003F244CE0
MLEDVYYLQNQLMQQGLSIDNFDDTDYYEMLEGMSARSREDRPKELSELLSRLGVGKK